MKTPRELVHAAFREASKREGSYSIIPTCVRRHLYNPSGETGAHLAGNVHDASCEELTRAVEFDRTLTRTTRELADFSAAMVGPVAEAEEGTP